MIDQNVSEILRNLIDPPPGMRGIAGVAGVLCEVFKCGRLIKVQVDEINKKPQFLGLVPQLIELCSKIADQSEDSGDWIEQPSAQIQFKTDHPIYAALYKLLENPKTMSRGRLQLLAHALVATDIGVLKGTDYYEMPEANVQAGFRELRRLGCELLDSVTFEGPGRDGCYQALKKVEQTEGTGFNPKDLDRLGHIRRLIGLSIGEETPRETTTRKDKGSDSDKGTEQVVREKISPDQLGNTGGEEFSLIDMHTAQRVELAAGRLDGLPDNDIAVAVKGVVSSERVNPKRGGSLTSFSFKKHCIADQLRLGAQALPTRWDRLTEYEVHSILSLLSWNDAGKNPGALAVGLVLLTGRALSVALNARLYGSTSDVPESVSDESIAICLEGHFIQVQVPTPKHSRALQADWESNLHQSHSQLRLPIVTLLWNLIAQFIGVEDSNWRGYLFSRPDHADVKASVEQIISDVRSETGARITLTRLQRCIYNEIADVQGDVAEAVFITGNQPSTGNHVGTHYYCVSEFDLQARYVETLRGMVMQARGELMRPVALCSERSFFIGSPLCLRPERLSVLISALRRRLNADLQCPVTAETLVNIHNSYTTYVLVLLAFATGYRSVRAPLSRITDYDQSSGMLVVADKTGSTFSHSRLVPVPELLCVQLDLYRQHRAHVVENMWALLGIKDPGHLIFFLSKASGKTKKSEKLVRVRPVTPTTMAKNLIDISNLPLNLNRHYLRSELRHRGVHAELVDAWMGHWFDGQEPMGRYSTLNPTDYMSGIAPTLNRMLDDMGWTAEVGLS